MYIIGIRKEPLEYMVLPIYLINAVTASPPHGALPAPSLFLQPDLCYGR